MFPVRLPVGLDWQCQAELLTGRLCDELWAEQNAYFALGESHAAMA